MITVSGQDRWRLIAATVACAFAALLFITTLLRAVTLDETEPVDLPGAGAGNGSAVTGHDAAPLTADALQLAVEQDPFAPDRQRPATRYRLPGDVDPEPPPLAPPAPPPPPFVLIGTVVDAATDAGSALIQLGEEPPQLITVGASLGGYRLARVAPEAAVMSNGERDVMLQLPGPQRQVVAAPVDTRERGNARGQNARQNTAPEMRQRMEAAREQVMRQMQMAEALERARQSGAPPEVLQTLERAIQQGGNTPIIIRRSPVPDTTQSSTPRAPDLR